MKLRSREQSCNDIQFRYIIDPYGRTVALSFLCRGFLFFMVLCYYGLASCDQLTIKGIINLRIKKNECMFEKKLGKTSKTRYYITINSEGSGLIVRS